MSKLSERAVPHSSDHGVRGAIDSLVLGSLVDLFQAYGVAVAPLPRAAPGRAPAIPELSAAIAFTRDGGGSGRLTLSTPNAVLDLTRNGATGMRQDWVRELTNQLMGRIKNRLLHFSARVEVGALNLLDSKLVTAHLERTQKVRVYAGRTLRGEVVVTIEGLPEESALVYVGAGTLPSEGDALFF